MSEARQLLERYCNKGDQPAFTTFYRLHADRLWRYLRARGCNEDDAYDLLSAAFLKFIQVICKDLRAPLALLYRIAINLHIDSYRHSRVAPVDAGLNLDDVASDPPRDGDIQGYLRKLIKILPENEQNLLMLRYWIGLTHKEIATAMEIPEGTIRRQCAEAMKKLKHRWQQGHDE